LVQRALDNLRKGRTSFVVAHRLSTVVDADLIVVLDQGRVVETGTHAELLARNGVYQRMYALQAL
jgi:subfamily B ATP-binding cassette protein MsbA